MNRFCTSSGAMPMPVSVISSRIVAHALAGQLDRHAAAVGVLDRVAHQVVDDLPEARGVDRMPACQPLVDLHGDLKAALPRQALEDVGHLLHDGPQLRRPRHHLQAAGLDLRDVQDVVDQAQQAARGTARQLDRLAVLRYQPPFAHQQLEHAHHRVHGGADLMAHGGQEVGLGAVRRLRLGARRLDQLDQVMALGHVDGAGDEGHPLAVGLERDRCRPVQHAPPVAGHVEVQILVDDGAVGQQAHVLLMNRTRHLR
ncbi:MAG TPA: hypothetical protein VLJ19_17700 [Variovorax sp.]|nr:hypothetical protein [Variovorax sp.]